MARTEIRGGQIKDESIASVDLASGSIRAGELHEECISGQPVLSSADSNSDRLLIWDADGSPSGSLKQIAPGNLGIGGGGGGSPAGADTQIQFNEGGSSFGASSNLTWDDTELKISGTGTSALLNLQTTENSSTASPVLELTRVSSSPADADYLGQIKFVGKHDGNGVTTYAKITGKIDDASANSEDGIIEFANVKGGSQTVTARLRSDSLQLLNGTNLVVDGTVYGKMMHMTHHRYNDGSGTGKEYIPWAGTSEQPQPSYISMGVAPYTGRLVKVLVRSSKTNPTMGSTEVAIHIGTNGTTTFNQSAEETVTVNMANANTTGTFSFANANHFAAGDTIAVGIDPTNAHGNVNVTCVWEYDITA